ncbi:MAG TPA: orotate phosphoribosyltransferase, partial [Azospirillaceae bacterium]|nr:orotate phosphoribosyltransferase [Azospirillaceae bacterium]
MIPDAWDIELREGALTTARLLLDTGAVTFDAEHPFTCTSSGLVSPIHVDTRRLLSDPEARSTVLTLAVRMIRQETDTGALDAVAAGQGVGEVWAALIADRLNLPLLHVRRDPPDDPHKHPVEGHVEPGWRVLLVDQLATDGCRKAGLAKPLRRAGCEVYDGFVIFQYGCFDTIHESLAPLGITLHALATWWDLLELAGQGHCLPG